MLDPDAKRLLDLIAGKSLLSYDSMPPLLARAHYKNSCFAVQPQAPKVGAVHNFSVPGPLGEIAVRCYRPQGATPQQVLPALVFFHGGGFTLGDLDTHDTLCRELCNQSQLAVFSVDYRLGPEHQFPAAHEDAFAALKWIGADAEQLLLDPARIAVGGDSAGANLAAACTFMARDAGGPKLAYQLLICPGTDFRCIAPSHTRNGKGYLLTSAMIDYFCNCYLKSDADRFDWRLSPTLAKDFSRLPPALVLTAGYDPLVDEGRDYAGLLQAAGNQVEYVCFSGQLHGFITMGGVIAEANEAVALCASRLRSV